MQGYHLDFTTKINATKIIWIPHVEYNLFIFCLSTSLMFKFYGSIYFFISLFILLYLSQGQFLFVKHLFPSNYRNCTLPISLTFIPKSICLSICLPTHWLPKCLPWIESAMYRVLPFGANIFYRFCPKRIVLGCRP